MAIKSWHAGLSQSNKLKLYGALGLATFAMLYIRRVNKNKLQVKSNDDDDEIIDNDFQSSSNHDNSSVILPISTSKVFWCSYLLTTSTWALTFSSTFQSFCTKYIPRIMSHRFSKSFEDLLPPVPKTMSQAFKLGQFQSELTKLENSNGSSEAINNLLLSATKMLGRHLDEQINSKQLHGVLKRILSIENSQSMISRIRGIFSFINIIWFFSILGISLTVIPVVYYIGKPIWDEIYNFFKKWLIKFGEFLGKILFNEKAYTIYEIFGYFICWYFMYLGYEGNTTIGFFTSFTGLALWMPMQWISLMRRSSVSGLGEPVLMAMSSLFSSLLSIPIAYNFNSKMLGLTAVAGLYSYLGFFIYGFFGGYIIGFQGDKAVANCVTTSIIFNTVLITAKMKNIDLYPYRMFIGPTLTMANSVLFLALLIHTSAWRSWWHRNRSVDYWQRQGLMIGSLTLGMAAGNILNYPALANTTYVYTGLYILQKIGEAPSLWKGPNLFFSIFGTSIVSWRLALYLHKNPQIITGMFKFE